MRCRLACLAVVACLVATTASAATRYHQYTEQFMTPKEPAKPIAAGYLGGGGDEYLSGGAFLPNGALLLAGTAYGPTFSPAGVDVKVLGRDGAAPAFKMPTKKKRDRVLLAPPDWSYLKGAGFIVQLDANCQRVVKAVRFPWASGSLTDIATDEKGNIYVCGIAGESFLNLTRPKAVRASGVDGPDVMYVGQLKEDLSGFDWCVALKDDAAYAPKLTLLDNGRINITAANAHHLDASGKVLKSTAVQKTDNWSRGVNPVTHATATGGDSNTGTGYEPWRQPVLHIYDDKGEHTDTFYRWSSKLVGTNWSRLVSDSDIRWLTYDKHGLLLVGAWSDGGNTVLETVPYDIKTGVNAAVRRRTGRDTGLGFSTWGAGVGSFLHLIKINPETGEPLAKTLFCAYLGNKNKPNGLNANLLDTAADNSLLLAGGSAWGLIETGSLKLNTLDPDEDYMGGPFIAVLSELMDDIRFSSAIPGGGAVDLARHNSNRAAQWNASSRTIDGKTRVVFVCGAEEDGKFKPRNAVQPRFGGGKLDGLYVVLEMDALKSVGAAPAKGDEPDGESAKSTTKKKRKDAPELTGKFQVSEGMDRDWCVLVMRDAAGKKWPTFYLGNPKGNATVDAEGSGTFTILGEGHEVELLEGSRQDKRLGGRFVKSETYTDRKGREKARLLLKDLEVQITLTGPTSANAVIRYNDRTIKVAGSANIRPSKPAGKGINLAGHFKTTKGTLGLNEGAADQDDVVTIEYWAPGRP